MEIILIVAGLALIVAGIWTGRRERGIGAGIEGLTEEFLMTAAQVGEELDARKAELAQILAEAKEVAASLKGARAPGPPARVPPDPRHDRVLSVYRSNHDLEETARETGLTKGEVQLILNLFGRRGA